MFNTFKLIPGDYALWVKGRGGACNSRCRLRRNFIAEVYLFVAHGLTESELRLMKNPGWTGTGVEERTVYFKRFILKPCLVPWLCHE